MWHELANDLYVLWTYFFEPIGGMFLIFWLFVVIAWRWKKHRERYAKYGPRFPDERP